MLATRLSTTAAFGRAGADQIPFHIRQATKDGDHQPSGAGGRVGPRFRQGAELAAGIDDAFDDGEQVEG